MAAIRDEIEHPRVVISYSHDSARHRGRVLQLADRLRSGGIDCDLDQYEVAPPEGWRQWMERRIEWADFVLLICTARFKQSIEGRLDGQGLGSRFEGKILLDLCYDAGIENHFAIPLLFDNAQPSDIPSPLRQYTYFRLWLQYEDLYRHLTGQPRILKPKLGSLRRLEPESISLKSQIPELPERVGRSLPEEGNSKLESRRSVRASKTAHRSIKQSGNRLVRLVNLTKGYSWRRPVLHDVNLTVSEGASVGVLGRNGSGKSTLLKLVAGRLRPDRGVIEVLGLNPFKHRRELVNQIGYVPEEPKFIEWMTVGEYLAFLEKGHSTWDRAWGFELLKVFDLSLGMAISSLSRGGRTQLALLAAIGHRPRLLILDDPSLGLDVFILASIREVLESYKCQTDFSLVSSTHNFSLFSGLFSQVLLLEGGRVVKTLGHSELASAMVVEIEPSAITGLRVLHRIEGAMKVDQALGSSGSPMILIESKHIEDEVLKALGECEVLSRRPATLRDIFLGHLQ